MKITLTILLVALVVTVQSATLNVRRIVNANAPPAPTNFVVAMIADNTTNVFLSWGNAATNYSTITIERSLVAPTWTVVTNIAGTNAAFTNAFNWTAAPVYYRIKATAANGLSSLYCDEP